MIEVAPAKKAADHQVRLNFLGERGKRFAKHPLQRVIFSLSIPTSGTDVARGAVLFTSQTRLSQAIFFSSGCKEVSHK
jgi:hypothetical protein